jgi:GNAT superfamily N-acetyltransferase
LTSVPVPDRRIEKLRRDHAIEHFDCGRETLNRFLHRFAWQSQQAGASQTYIALVAGEVIGYYSLTVGNVKYEDAPERLAKGLARHPIPIMLLARLGVDRRWHGRGIGTGLLKDAMLRTLQAADIAGIRAFVVHAKDEEAKHFYAHFNLIPFPTDPLHLFALLKDVRSFLSK